MSEAKTQTPQEVVAPKRRGRPPKALAGVPVLAVEDIERQASLSLARAAIDEIIRVSTSDAVRRLAEYARGKLGAAAEA